MKTQSATPRFALATRITKLVFGIALAATSFVALTPTSQASSHSDAPLIKLDPQANLTDVYAFVRTRATGERVLVVEVSVRPFSEPGDGGEYEAFSDDARYSIHIANPVTGADIQRYDFQFSPVSTNGNYKNLNTILRYGRGANVGGNPDAGPIMTVGDAHQNFTQSYNVTRVVGATSTVLNGTTVLLVPPPNVGVRTTPLYNDMSGTPTTNPNFGKAISGAATSAATDPYTAQTRYNFVSGTATYTTFCGTREDGFFSDIPGIFDLLDPRILDNNNGGLTPPFGQDGNGVDGFKGFNVLHYSIVIPLAELPTIAYQAPFTNGGAPGVGARNGVGVYASVSRPRLTLRTTTGAPVSSGPFIQVNRLANPLFNEALVALADKDNYNRTSPTADAASFATYAMNSELAALINVAVFGNATGAGPLVTTGRSDLAAVYIPDVIRVDTTTPSVRVSGDAGFSRFSFLAGDTLTTSGGQTIPGGWPNGRRFGDDVIDIALTAVASGPSYSSITLVGDNVPANDQVYNRVFPYAATPNPGPRNSKDSGPNVGQ